MTKRKKRSLAEVMGREMEQRKKDMLFEHEVRKYFKKKNLPDPFKELRGFKKGGKVDDVMKKILKGMSAKERKLFLESMGFATKDKEGVSRSYRKAGGKMKSKGYKAGGKMKSKGYAGGGKVKEKITSEDKMTKSQTGLSKKKASPSKKKKRTKDNELFSMLLGQSLDRQMGVMPGETFKAGGKIKSKGYKAGGKMKSKGYKAGGKMKKKPQSGHNRLY